MIINSIPPLQLDSYQRAMRLILSNHIVTEIYPDKNALSLIRQWATQLREDMLNLWGYRLEVTETTARVFPSVYRLDNATPAKTSTDREFDRRRYSYLSLALAVLGRGASQITLSELAATVAAEALHINGVDLSVDRAADRDGFVDAVSWLAGRGALTLADGDAGAWSNNPGIGEALYDIDRNVVTALFRPPQILQDINNVETLLSSSIFTGQQDENTGILTDPLLQIRSAGKQLLRELIEQPVVYFASLSDQQRMFLNSAEDYLQAVEKVTGLSLERRAEGIALIDQTARLSEIRFPGTGTIAQVALLLVGEIADRVLDADAPALPQAYLTDAKQRDLINQLNSSLPSKFGFDFSESSFQTSDYGINSEISGHQKYPIIEMDWLLSVTQELSNKFGRTFSAQWQSNIHGLASEALQLLIKMKLLAHTEGGVLVLPILARYRDVVAHIRTATAQTALFTNNEEATAE
ncbi:MAG: DUF2398 family protein [Mycobacteriaceae bacterium]